ncbi:MAG: flagellar hook-length control protein FliK [Acidobacteriaceae bacterium]
MDVATSVTGNGAGIAPMMAGRPAGQRAGNVAGNAGVRGGAVFGRSAAGTASGVGAMPSSGATTGPGAMPSFGELMMQQGVMAGKRMQSPVAEGAEEFTDAGEAKAAPTAEDEGDPVQVGDGLPAFSPLASGRTGAATGAPSGEETRGGEATPGLIGGSESGLRAGLTAPRTMEKTATAQRPAMDAVLMKTQTAGSAVISKLPKAATPVNGKSRTSTGTSPVGGANATVTTSGAVLDVAASAHVAAVQDRAAAPAANGNGAAGKVSGSSAATRPAAAVQTAAAPAAGKDTQSAGGQDATNGKDLPGQIEPGSDAHMKSGQTSLPAGVISTEVAAHKSADMAHAVALAGTAVPAAGLGQVVNSVEAGQSGAAVTSAGASLLHGVQGTSAAPSSAMHATAGGTFARMDAAAEPVVTESSPQRLAVGVRDAGLGWVEIRTHAAGGQVSAVLTAASSEAQAALSAHLPEVREYLAGQQVRVDQLSSEQRMPGGGEGAGREPSGNAGNAQAGNAPGGSASAGNSDAQEQGSAAALYAGDGESLSYINVRV